MGNLYTSRIFRHFLPQRLIRKPRSATKDNNADGGKLRREKPPTETSAAPSTQHKIQLDLPVELLLHVFMHLPAFDLLRCRSVCKHFKTIIDESPETQYMTELHAAGYQNNELCTDMGTAARLDALKKEVRFWRNPTGSWNRTSFPWSVTYEDLCCTSWHDNFWARSKKLAGVVEGKWNAVQCVLLQRAVSGPPVAESWQLTFPFSFISITAHPPESTLVLLDVEVSHTPRHEHYVLWKVSALDGTVLSKMTVPVNSDMDINWGEPEFSAKGDVVSIIRQARPEAFSFLTFIDITLIDVSDSSIIASKTTAVHKSTVIAPQHVDNKCILLHIMNGGEYCTEVWAVVPITNGQELCHIATFGFPTVHPSLVAPLNGSIAGSSGGGLMTGNVPAVPCVRSTTNPLVFLLRYYNGLRNPTAPPTRVIHIFPLSVITSVVDAYTNTQTPREMPRFRPWKEWGPRNSRCFVDNTTVITGSYGSQMVLSNYSLLDFNPRDIARDLHYLEKSSPSASSMSRSSAVGRRIRSLGRRGSDDGDVEMPDGGVIVRRPTVYRKGKLFMEDVITSLPYRESKLNWTGPRPVLIFGGEVWVICTFENESDGTISHKCYTLSQ